MRQEGVLALEVALASSLLVAVHKVNHQHSALFHFQKAKECPMDSGQELRLRSPKSLFDRFLEGNALVYSSAYSPRNHPVPEPF